MEFFASSGRRTHSVTCISSTETAFRASIMAFDVETDSNSPSKYSPSDVIPMARGAANEIIW